MVCGASCGGCGAGQRDDARGLILVPPLGRCWARIGGVRQVMPPWPGSWVVPVPAPWCAWMRGGWCVHDVFDVGAVDIVIRWAAELRRMAVSWPWFHRSSGTHDGVSYRRISADVVDVVVIHGGGEWFWHMVVSWPWLRCHGVWFGWNAVSIVIHWYAQWRTGKSFDFSADMVVAIRWAAVQFVLRVRRPVLQMRLILVLSEVSCNSCFIEKHIPPAPVAMQGGRCFGLWL